MAFTYVIGEDDFNGAYAPCSKRENAKCQPVPTLELIFAEHMEEDDPTLRALPRWVELEYKVSRKSALFPIPDPGRGLTDELERHSLNPNPGSGKPLRMPTTHFRVSSPRHSDDPLPQTRHKKSNAPTTHRT